MYTSAPSVTTTGSLQQVGDEIRSLFNSRRVQHCGELQQLQRVLDNLEKQQEKSKILFNRMVSMGVPLVLSLGLPYVVNDIFPPLLFYPIVFFVSYAIISRVNDSLFEYLTKCSDAFPLKLKKDIEPFDLAEAKDFLKIDFLLLLYRSVKDEKITFRILKLLQQSPDLLKLHLAALEKILKSPSPQKVFKALLSNFDFWQNLDPIFLSDMAGCDNLENVIRRLDSLKNNKLLLKILALRSKELMSVLSSWKDLNIINHASLEALISHKDAHLIVGLLNSNFNLNNISPDVLKEILCSSSPEKRLEIVGAFTKNKKLYDVESEYRLDLAGIQKILCTKDPVEFLKVENPEFLKVSTVLQVEDPLSVLLHIRKEFGAISDQRKFESKLYYFIVSTIKKDLSLGIPDQLECRNMPFPADAYSKVFDKYVATTDDSDRNCLYEHEGHSLGVCRLFIEDMNRSSLFIQDGEELFYLNDEHDSNDPYPEALNQVILWKERRIQKLREFCGSDKKLFELSRLFNQSLSNIPNEIIANDSSTVFLRHGGFSVPGIEEGTKLVISKNQEGDIVLEALQIVDCVEKIFHSKTSKFKRLNPDNSNFSFSIKITLGEDGWKPNRDNWIKYRFHFQNKLS